MAINLLKSVLHNIGVVALSIALAYLGTLVDSLLSIQRFSSTTAKLSGVLLLTLGFLLRVWATFHFYRQSMRVVSLEPQTSLITSGPYRFSRNPLYLGANVFCFFGAALLLGSWTSLAITALHLPFMNLMIRREERQLEQKFGEEFREYKKRVRRWV